ncbi:MAG TPA: hypothetical protein VIH20_03845 [Candidatus Subteraquimicrobiales bacterium]
MELNELLAQPVTFRKKVFKLGGNKVSVFDPQGGLVLFVKQKAFKLKEDIRVYSDDSLKEERLLIKARKIMDFRAAYDVIDPKTNAKVGALRRKGWSSIIKDQWEMLNADDQPIGSISEDSTALALVRRFLTNLIPQSYGFNVNGHKVAELKQHFNPFVLKASLTVSPDNGFDPRIALAGAVLLMTIEGRQQ